MLKEDADALESVRRAEQIEPNNPQTIFLELLIHLQSSNTVSGTADHSMF